MGLIEKRHSVRKFKDTEVDAALLGEIAKAGLYAPSSKNKQPFHIVVIDEVSLMNEIAAFHPNWVTLKNANKAIVVCGDLACDEREVHTVIACSAATQNILLKCTEQGVGAVWLGLYPDTSRVKFMKEILNLSEEKLPISLIAIGYPQVETEKVKQIDESKLQFNKSMFV